MDSYLRKIFYKDLMQSYREVYPTCSSQTEAYEKTVNHAAPRYYVGLCSAYNYILNITKGKHEKYKSYSRNKIEMFDSLYAEVVRLSGEKDFCNMNLHNLVAYAILRPAPSFFITKKTFKLIYNSIKRNGLENKDNNNSNKRTILSTDAQGRVHCQ